ncbi:hypothetical protein K2173_016545 [Erythroxylum novogranatense]|uniref:Uncharacterized protein n=1 Tax=Erythroxylum novogranatense TaxID=1862640 RepID=A0AAV8SS26_9ROSI|nr:hypothetical protein K2173_016545 [Erythroxylum novogranatense]
MGKSSSYRKKLSKHSSSIRTRKRSKTRRSKPIKLRRDYDSDSYSKDDSRSSMYVSLSSSEDKHRSRRFRSRSRKDVKNGKKRARSWSSSSEDSSPLKRRKGSKRNCDAKEIKKLRKKKKRGIVRGERIISSMSSRLRSCSACGLNSSSAESEYKRQRDRSERRGNHKRKFEKCKSASRRKLYRSRNFSSCSRGETDSSCQSLENFTVENTSKRLRSVVMLTRDDNDGRKDEHKEEMIYEHGDYPCRSNDSNEGSKRDTDNQSHVASDKKRSTEGKISEDITAFDTKISKISERDKDREVCCERTMSNMDRVGTKDAVGKNEDSSADDVVDGGDLELILRQKALANLRRFCGGFSSNAKSSIDQEYCSQGMQEDSAMQDGKKISYHHQYGPLEDRNRSQQAAISGNDTVTTYVDSEINKLRLIESTLGKEISSGNCTTIPMERPSSHELNEAKFVKKGKVGDGGALTANMMSSLGVSHNDDEVNKACMNTFSVVSSSQNHKKIGDGKISGSEESAESNIHSLDKVAITGRERARKAVGSNIDRPRLVRSIMSQPFSNATTNMMEAACALQETNQTNSATGNTCTYKGAAQAEHNVSQTSGNNDTTIVGSSSNWTSHTARAAADTSMNRLQDEGKGVSQLEKKTMTVMRGGEMVQVSYKVYIPKKTPALARRQLKR